MHLPFLAKAVSEGNLKDTGREKNERGDKKSQPELAEDGVVTITMLRLGKGLASKVSLCHNIGRNRENLSTFRLNKLISASNQR